MDRIENTETYNESHKTDLKFNIAKADFIQPEGEGSSNQNSNVDVSQMNNMIENSGLNNVDHVEQSNIATPIILTNSVDKSIDKSSYSESDSGLPLPVSTTNHIVKGSNCVTNEPFKKPSPLIHSALSKDGTRKMDKKKRRVFFSSESVISGYNNAPNPWANGRYL